MARTVSVYSAHLRVPALACVLALALHGLWPALPMPASWLPAAEAVGTPVALLATAAGCGTDTLPDAPQPKSSDHPLACNLCAYLHAAGGLPALPGPVLGPPTMVGAVTPGAPLQQPPRERLRGAVHSRAPPAFPLA